MLEFGEGKGNGDEGGDRGVGRVDDVAEKEVEMRVWGWEVGGASCAYGIGDGRSSLERDGGSVCKGVCTLVEMAFYVVEVGRDVSIEEGSGVDFDEA